MKFAGLSAAYVNAYSLNIDEPAAPCVAVRMADSISSHRATTAAITELGHLFPSLIACGTTNLCIVS